MSQIYFTSKNGKQVMTGYDRPLNFCFLTVYNPELVTVTDTAPYMEYSSLGEKDGCLWTADEVIEKLEELGIDYPTDLRQRLYDHERRYAGNEVFRY